MNSIQNQNMVSNNFYNNKVNFQGTLSKGLKKDLLEKYHLSPEQVQSFVNKYKRNSDEVIIKNVEVGGGLIRVGASQNNKDFVAFLPSLDENIPNALDKIVKSKVRFSELAGCNIFIP